MDVAARHGMRARSHDARGAPAMIARSFGGIHRRPLALVALQQRAAAQALDRAAAAQAAQRAGRVGPAQHRARALVPVAGLA